MQIDFLRSTQFFSFNTLRNFGTVAIPPRPTSAAERFLRQASSATPRAYSVSDRLLPRRDTKAPPCDNFLLKVRVGQPSKWWAKADRVKWVGLTSFDSPSALFLSWLWWALLVFLVCLSPLPT